MRVRPAMVVHRVLAVDGNTERQNTEIEQLPSPVRGLRHESPVCFPDGCAPLRGPVTPHGRIARNHQWLIHRVRGEAPPRGTTRLTRVRCTGGYRLSRCQTPTIRSRSKSWASRTTSTTDRRRSSGAAHRRRTGHVFGDVVRALQLQVVQVHLRYFGDHHRRDAGLDARRYRRERRRRRHRRRLGGHLQGRVAQPSELRRAVPGVRPPAWWHRPRHHGDEARGRSRSWTSCGSVPPMPRHPARRRRWCAVWAVTAPPGLPNVGGETVFDASCAGNPLVNALCAGVLRVEDLNLARISGAGNKIILFGAHQARRHRWCVGAWRRRPSTTAREDGRNRKETAERSGWAIRSPEGAHRMLPGACTAVSSSGIQDLGGAGLSCATSELAAAGDGGMHIDPEGADARHRDDPAEVLSSESQERMCAVVTPDNVDAFMAVCRKLGCAGDRHR